MHASGCINYIRLYQPDWSMTTGKLNKGPLPPERCLTNPCQSQTPQSDWCHLVMPSTSGTHGYPMWNLKSRQIDQEIASNQQSKVVYCHTVYHYLEQHGILPFCWSDQLLTLSDANAQCNAYYLCTHGNRPRPFSEVAPVPILKAEKVSTCRTKVATSNTHTQK